MVAPYSVGGKDFAQSLSFNNHDAAETKTVRVTQTGNRTRTRIYGLQVDAQMCRYLVVQDLILPC